MNSGKGRYPRNFIVLKCYSRWEDDHTKIVKEAEEEWKRFEKDTGWFQDSSKKGINGSSRNGWSDGDIFKSRQYVKFDGVKEDADKAGIHS